MQENTSANLVRNANLPVGSTKGVIYNKITPFCFAFEGQNKISKNY